MECNIVESIQNKNQQLKKDKDKLLQNNHNLHSDIERLEAELATLKKAKRWRKFSEEKPAHHQWIFVINPNCSKYASPIETRRWDDGMKFDVEVQELYKVWMPQIEGPEGD